MNIDWFKKIKVQTPEEVLYHLVGQAKSITDAEVRVPTVRITMGPHIFSGEPLKIEEAAKEPYLVLLNREGGDRRLDALSYIPLKAISTVTLLEFDEKLAYALAKVALPPPPGEVPSKLELMRMQDSVIAKLKEAGWVGTLQLDPGEATAEGLYRLKQLMTALPKAVAELNRDNLGREALVALKTFALQSQSGTGFEGSKQGSTLTLKIGVACDTSALEAKLNSVLQNNL